MASSSSSSSSSFSAFNCIGFVLILLLSFDMVRAARPAADYPMLKVCSRTTYPKTCTECIATDTGRATNYDLRGMIKDILFCTSNHVTNALYEAYDLANNCTTTDACSNKDAIVKCHSSIFDARQLFAESFNYIEGDISKIQADLLEARTKLNGCAYQQFAGQSPLKKMIDEMDTTKRLQEIGTYLCQLAPTMFVQP